MLLEPRLQGLSVSVLGTQGGLTCTSETLPCCSLLSAPSLAVGHRFYHHCICHPYLGTLIPCPGSSNGHYVEVRRPVQPPGVKQGSCGPSSSHVFLVLQWKGSFYVGELPLWESVRGSWDPALEDRWDLMEPAGLHSVSALASPRICPHQAFAS